MILNQKAKYRLIQHFMCLDVLKHEAIRLSNLISKWCKDSGAEWTVKRLKALQSAHKESLQTGSYVIADGWATRVNRKGQTIYKDRLIHSMMTSTNSERKLKTSLVFFRMHEIIKMSRTTEAQFNKWIEGVTSDYTDEPRVRSRIKELTTFIKRIKLPKPFSNWDEFTPLVYQPVREKTSPVMTDGRVSSKHRSDVSTVQLTPLRSRGWLQLLQRHPIQASKCLFGNGAVKLPFEWLSQMGPVDHNICGSIGFIQEKSAKLRAVASPFLVIQAMGEPAKKQLNRLSKSIREMHTHDQDAAKQLVSDALSRGQTVHGYDASAFTDRLPFELQEVVMDLLLETGWLTEFDCQSIKTVVNSDWAVNGEERKSFDVTSVKWKVGQPMGYGPSFHLAAITHWTILVSCAMKLGLDYANKFAVVGDDVSIFDDEIAKEYYLTMTDLGVDINLDKSVVSKEIAEFCKKIILPGTVIESISVQDNLYEVDAIVSSISFYGPKFLRFATKEQLDRASKALLPPEMGGLSLTPSSMSYRSYLTLVLDTDRLKKRNLLKQVLDFYDMPSYNALEFTLSTVSRRYEFWSKPENYSISKSEDTSALQVPADVIISEWTGLPVLYECPSPEGNERDEIVSRGCNNTFSEIYDSSIRELLTLSSGNLIRPTKQLFSNNIFGRAYGYINRLEKAPKRPIKTMEKLEHDENVKNQIPSVSWSNERRKIRSFLRRDAKSLNW